MSFGSKKEWAQICMTKWTQSHRLWKNVAWGFILYSIPPAQWTVGEPQSLTISSHRTFCPVRRPVTTLECVLLQDRNLAFVPIEGPEIYSRACLCVLPRPHHHTQSWLTNHSLILLLISCLETPKAGSVPANFRAEPPLRARRRFRFLVLHHVQRPNTTPQRAR